MSSIQSHALLALSIFATVNGHPSSPAPSAEVLERDVCIIGGGSSGTYSAIRLREEGKSVAVIEKQNRLGGHVDTYRDPTTGETFDYGVISFDNNTVVRDYFEHFNIPLAPLDFSASSPPVYADFANGEKVPASTLAQGNVTAALMAYGEQLQKYPYLVNGFNLPEEVPEDLLLTWGEFIDKYDLGALAYTVFSYNQGVGNILDLPVLYIFKYFNYGELLALNGGFVTTAEHDNQELYDRALAELGTSAFTSSNVTEVKRNDGCVEVRVSTPEGPKLIRASKLLISIPPKLANLQFLDVDPEESSIFGQFNNTYYWDAVLNNTGIPDNTSYSNVDPAAPYGIPAMPALYGISSSSIPGLKTAYSSSPYALSDEQARAQMLETVTRLVESQGGSEMNGMTEFVGFNRHAPFELHVPAEAIKGGFYGRLEGLQGKRNTWWTGATWQAPDSSAIWSFTEQVVLPQLLE